MTEITAEAVIQRYRRARDRRATWESLWQECFDFALPQRETALGQAGVGGASRKTDRLFDGTAPDAVDQLAASLLSQLTPPWARWFGLTPGSKIEESQRPELSKELEAAAQTLQSHFDRSNFAVEMHQCYLDLVTAGTASLMFEAAPPGEPSAFRFTAVPLSQVAFEEDVSGRLDTTFRASRLTRAQIVDRFPKAKLPDNLKERKDGEGEPPSAEVLEAVFPVKGGFDYIALIDPGEGGGDAATVLKTGRFDRSPFINFRWLKAPGEIYGRSPVMKTLPDIKTANKVVELVLKNASIAVTGIWQADDDGVLNPSNIRLTPGTIIPKAVGSAGLKPLEAPGRFDMSQVVLQDLRAAIRRALLADRLGQIEGPRMTATEVLERVAEISRLLGATYGRLQSELLTPLVTRGLGILTRRGEIPAITIDGQAIDLEYKSPLARHQAQQDVQATLAFLDGLARLGPQAIAIIDVPQTAQVLANAFGVPSKILKSQDGGGLPGVLDPAMLAQALPPEMSGMLDQMGGPDALPQLAGAGGLDPDMVKDAVTAVGDLFAGNAADGGGDVQ
ncbi:MAG: phage tail protein [Rhodospirillaceae bacterium]|nr:phage tail protein [Rhodospirillaceae bacterium]